MVFLQYALLHLAFLAELWLLNEREKLLWRYELRGGGKGSGCARDMCL